MTHVSWRKFFFFRALREPLFFMKFSWNYHEKLTFHFISFHLHGWEWVVQTCQFISFHNFHEAEGLNFISFPLFWSWNGIWWSSSWNCVCSFVLVTRDTERGIQRKGRVYWGQKTGVIEPKPHWRSTNLRLLQKLSEYHVQLFKFRCLSMCRIFFLYSGELFSWRCSKK